MTDAQLIQDFVQKSSQPAFSQLVARHVDMVYGSAIRRTRDPATAEDITQAVFILLSKKAASLNRHTSIAGWLMQATHFTSLAHQRQESRRRKHEQAAAAQATEILSETESVWQSIQPQIDQAILRLSASDRDAVALRFFHSKSYVEVGQQLGITEDTARKRVERAIERLKGFLIRDGETIAPSALLTAVDLHATIHAPAHLAMLSTTTSSTLLAKGALAIMTAKKTAAIIGAVVGATLIAGSAIVTVSYLANHSDQAVAQSTPPGQTTTLVGGTISSDTVSITGSVKSPGSITLDADIQTVKQAIQAAGGATIEKGIVRIVRKGLSTSSPNRSRSFTITSVATPATQPFPNSLVFTNAASTDPVSGTPTSQPSQATLMITNTSPNSGGVGPMMTGSGTLVISGGKSVNVKSQNGAVTLNETAIGGGGVSGVTVKPGDAKNAENLRNIGQAIMLYSNANNTSISMQAIPLEDLMSGKIADMPISAGDQIVVMPIDAISAPMPAK